jgi:hypothetical protein
MTWKMMLVCRYQRVGAKYCFLLQGFNYKRRYDPKDNTGDFKKAYTSPHMSYRPAHPNLPVFTILAIISDQFLVT